MPASLTMSQIHVCFVNANVDVTRNQDLAVFSVIVVHVFAQSALSNHGALTGTLHHLASATILTAAMVLLKFPLYLVIVYKQTSRKSVHLSTALSQAVCSEVNFLSLVTSSLPIVSSELLRGLSSDLLA